MRHLYDSIMGKGPMDVARPGIGGEGEEAREFVQRILANAESVRLEIDAHRAQRDLHSRQLAYVIAMTPQGEVNVNEELIRAGYSSYNQDFGRSTRFHDKFLAAEREAQLSRRGMWGGKGPDKVRYQEEATKSPTENVLGQFGRSAIDIVDADTFNIGLFGRVRFLNVQTAETSSYPRRRNDNNQEMHLWRMTQFMGMPGIDTTSARLGWQGVRQSYPTSPGQFEVMKPHALYDFPGGRKQDWKTKERMYFLDLETQGMWGTSETRVGGKWVRRGRHPLEQIRISEIAYIPEKGIKGKPTGYRSGIQTGGGSLSIHTWLKGTMDEQLLKGFTDQDLKELIAGKENKRVTSVLKQISANANTYNMPSHVLGSKQPLWDPAAAVHGSVPNTAARRMLAELLTEQKGAGKSAVHTFKETADKLVSHWKGADHRVMVSAWNAGYDFPILIRNIFEAGFEEVADLVKTGKVRPMELGSALHRMRFDRMWSDDAYNLAMTDRAKLKGAFLDGVRKFGADDLAKGGRHEGVVKDNRPLRKLMDDMLDSQRGGSKVHDRMTQWLRKQNLRGSELRAAEQLAGDWANRLSGVTDFDTFQSLLTDVQKGSMDHVKGKWSMKRGKVVGSPISAMGMLNDWYRSDIDRHINIFGDWKQLQYLSGMDVPMAGIHNPFQFGMGARLQDVVKILGERADSLGVSEASAKKYKAFLASADQANLIENQAHQGYYDTATAKSAYRDITRISSSEKYKQAWFDAEDEFSWTQKLSRINQQMDDFIASSTDKIPGTKTGADFAKRMGRKWPGLKEVDDILPGWKVAGAFIVAGYFLGRHNKEKPEYQQDFIEGVRKPESDWAGVGGIDPSQMPFANLSVYSSGRDNSKAPLPVDTKPGSHQKFQAATTVMAHGGMLEKKKERQFHRQQVRSTHRTEHAMTEPKIPLVDSGPAPKDPVALSNPPPNIPVKGVELSHPSSGSRPLQLEMQDSHPGPQMKDHEGSEGFQWKSVKQPSKPGCPAPMSHGHAGYSIQMSDPRYANMSKVRDHATQLHRLPGMVRTMRGRQKPVISHAEYAYHETVAGGR